MLRDMDSPDSRRLAYTLQTSIHPGQSCIGISLLVFGYSDVGKTSVCAFCGSDARRFVAESIAERAR